MLPRAQAYPRLPKQVRVAPRISLLSFQVTSKTHLKTQSSPPDSFILLEELIVPCRAVKHLRVCG